MAVFYLLFHVYRLLASPAVTQRSKNEDILSWIQHGSGDLDAKARNHLANKLEIAVKRYQQKYSPSPAVIKTGADKSGFTPIRPMTGTFSNVKKELFSTPASIEQQPPFVNGASYVPEFNPPFFAELDEEEDFVDAQEWIIPSLKKGIPSLNAANVQRHDTYLVKKGK